MNGKPEEEKKNNVIVKGDASMPGIDKTEIATFELTSDKIATLKSWVPC